MSANTLIKYIYLNDNNLSGLVPSLSTNSALIFLNVSGNSLSGSIPSLNNNSNLTDCYLSVNNFTGDIPNLSGTSLTTFHAPDNSLSGYRGGDVTSTLTDFRATINDLTESAVNSILVAFSAAGGINGNILLQGGTNASPTGQGISAKTTLVNDRGWTVTTN